MLLPRKEFGLSANTARKEYVWSKARIFTPSLCSYLRLDCNGRLIAWSEYGKTDSALGWEIDHVIPLAKGGLDALSNLQTLHWRNNRTKSDKVM